MRRMLGELDQGAWHCLVAAQRAVAQDGGEEISLEYLHAALLEHDTSVRESAVNAGINISRIKR